jgi:hypothetical protein
VKFQNDLALQLADMLTCSANIQTGHAPQCKSPQRLLALGAEQISD